MCGRWKNVGFTGGGRTLVNTRSERTYIYHTSLDSGRTCLIGGGRSLSSLEVGIRVSRSLEKEELISLEVEEPWSLDHW